METFPLSIEQLLLILIVIAVIGWLYFRGDLITSFTKNNDIWTAAVVILLGIIIAVLIKHFF